MIDTQAKHKHTKEISRKKGKGVKFFIRAEDSGVLGPKIPVWSGDSGVMTGDSGLVPARRTARVRERKFDPLTLKSRKFRPNWARKRRAKVDQIQGQVSNGSKPQSTHQIKRSIQKQIGAKIFGIFEFMVDMGERSQIRGNQKLLIPVDMGSLLGLTHGWSDLHGFVAGSEGIPDEHDERNTNTR